MEKKKIKKSRAKPTLEALIIKQCTAKTLKPPFKQIATLQHFNGKERELDCEDGVLVGMCSTCSPYVLSSSAQAAFYPG